MSKLCRQVSIEQPGPNIKECVWRFDTPMPDVPPRGARIKVVCAGACYSKHRNRSNSVCSNSSLTMMGSLTGELDEAPVQPSEPAHVGVRDGSLFPGYEVAGIIDAIGPEAEPQADIKEGTRVVVMFPPEEVPMAYADYVAVPDVQYLVPVPEHFALSTAAILPTGAVLAMNAATMALERIKEILEGPDNKETASLMIVGTGGLALWALRIAIFFLKKGPFYDRVKLNVATLSEEGFQMAEESHNVHLVEWNDNLYETQMLERTLDICGRMDVIINFGSKWRSLNRSLKCLNPDGVVLVSQEVGEKLVPRYKKVFENSPMNVKTVPNGTVEQLREMVQYVSSKQIEPIPHVVFPMDKAQEVIAKLCNSEIHGRAVLEFQPVF